MDRKPLQVYFTEKKLNELRELSRELDMPMGALIRIGVEMVLKKYERGLLKIVS